MQFDPTGFTSEKLDLAHWDKSWGTKKNVIGKDSKEKKRSPIQAEIIHFSSSYHVDKIAHAAAPMMTLYMILQAQLEGAAWAENPII